MNKKKIIGWIKADTEILLKPPKNKDKYIKLFIELKPFRKGRS